MTQASTLNPIAFSAISGWREDQLDQALAAFQRSAQEIIERGNGFKRLSRFGGGREDWLAVCEKAGAAASGRDFFESEFSAFRVEDEARPRGLFTGYYEPIAEGSLTRSAEYPVPIYAKPDDLMSFNPEDMSRTGLSYGRKIDGQPRAYHTRKEIEQGALSGSSLEICFLKSWVDAFFIHVQGNGRVILPDGGTIRLSYAGKNGQPYTGIGSVLLKRGIGTPQTMSMQLLRLWMADHPSETRDLLWHNSSFIFFRVTQIDEPHLGAIGAAKVTLTPVRGLAVDRAVWAFGTPLFVETHEPPEAKASSVPFNHLMIAQDTGTAIKGVVRGDVYWGWGETAAHNAGHMKSPGGMVALLPRALAKRLAP